MKRKPFRLTYYGGHATRGFVTRNLTIPDERNHMPKNPAQFTLREAMNFCREHGNMAVQADSCPISLRCPPRWFDFVQETPRDHTLSVTVSLHLPPNVTPSSAMRVARLVGCYGIR